MVQAEVTPMDHRCCQPRQYCGDAFRSSVEYA